jgi:hypothetical protein
MRGAVRINNFLAIAVTPRVIHDDWSRSGNIAASRYHNATRQAGNYDSGGGEGENQ